MKIPTVMLQENCSKEKFHPKASTQCNCRRILFASSGYQTHYKLSIVTIYKIPTLLLTGLFATLFYSGTNYGLNLVQPICILNCCKASPPPTHPRRPNHSPHPQHDQCTPGTDFPITMLAKGHTDQNKKIQTSQESAWVGSSISQIF